ncbi:hypothetical protein GCM10009623_23420 [Nocardioides aestuarii]|uniref:Uncharacterized protein n=1 Tax=Nocardioides aestuarii TaxID=252231 RepID=A0ABW4TLI1_9ACTN
MTTARVVLSLAEVVLAARLAGDLPLPFARPAPGAGRLAARLAGTRPHRAEEVLDAELARVEDAGPDGAAATLVRRGLLDGDGVDARLATALRLLALAPVAAVLDVVVSADRGDRPLRAWWAVGEGRLSGLVLRGATTLEVVSAPVEAWVAELARLVPVGSGDPPSGAVTVTSEALLGAISAHRRGRPDLVATLAPGEADLLHALAGRCRGRLRLLVLRRHAAPPPAVTVWVLLDDGWRSLRPLRGARVEVAHRRPPELGLASYASVRAA